MAVCRPCSIARLARAVSCKQPPAIGLYLPTSGESRVGISKDRQLPRLRGSGVWQTGGERAKVEKKHRTSALSTGSATRLLQPSPTPSWHTDLIFRGAARRCQAHHTRLRRNGSKKKEESSPKMPHLSSCKIPLRSTSLTHRGCSFIFLYIAIGSGLAVRKMVFLVIISLWACTL